jgi:hypothetical protein
MERPETPPEAKLDMLDVVAVMELAVIEGIFPATRGGLLITVPDAGGGA